MDKSTYVTIAHLLLSLFFSSFEFRVVECDLPIAEGVVLQMCYDFSGRMERIQNRAADAIDNVLSLQSLTQ